MDPVKAVADKAAVFKHVVCKVHHPNCKDTVKNLQKRLNY